MEILRKYGTSTTIYFPLVDKDASDFESTPVTFASGDTQISKDGGAFANTSNNPAHEGNGMYSLVLTSTEMEAGAISITVIDQTDPKLWEDQAALLVTQGNAAAQYEFSNETITNAISNIGASGGGSINFSATEDNTAGAIIDSVTFVGSVQGGTDFEDTGPGIANSHNINDTGNDIDIVYGFNVGGGRLATSVFVNADTDGGTDNLDVEVYDHVNDAWDALANVDDNAEITIPLTSKYTGTGAELGNVYVRFDNNNATTPSNLEVFELLVSAVNVGQTVGYADGAIWIDTENGVAGTESFVNGTADNPVDSIADALTLSTNIGLKRFRVATGSTITLAATANDYDFDGNAWTLAFGGQNIAGTSITGATVSGTFLGSTAILKDCIINAITGPGITMRRCYLNDVAITANAASDWYLNDCRSRVAGTGSPNFDFGAGIANVNVSMRAYSGGIEIENIGDTGTDLMSMEGDGKITLNANCDGGTIAVRGNIRIADNSGGNVTLEITPDSNGYQEGAVWVDEENGTSSGSVVGIDGVFQNQSDDFDNAQSIAATLGTGNIIIHPGNSITLSQALSGFTITNVQATLNGGSQNIDATRVNGGFVTGTFGRAGTGVPTFNVCQVNGVTADRVAMLGCGILGTFTMTEAGLYVFKDCQAAGLTGISTVDYASLDGATANFERWTGNLTIVNMAAGDTLNLHCTSGGDIILGGVGGTVNISGAVGTVTDNRTGSPTLNDKSISLANINAEADTALSNYDAPTKAELDTAIGTIPTAAENRAEMDSNSTQLAAILTDTGTTIPADLATIAGYIDTEVSAIKAVTDNLPDGGALTSIAQGSDLTSVASDVSAILTDTDTTIPALIAALENVSVSDILTTQMTESYAADGTAPTLAQALFLIQQSFTEFAIAGTTITVKELDGSTTAATFTMDDASTPTSRTRAS